MLMDTSPKFTKDEELDLKGVAAELNLSIEKRHLRNVRERCKWKKGKFLIEYFEDSITIQGELNGEPLWRKFDAPLVPFDEDCTEHTERILQSAIRLWAESAVAEFTKGPGWRREGTVERINPALINVRWLNE